MEAAGLDVVETDLGEFIVQISHDKPSHLVAPIVHKDKASIAQLFSEYFKTPYNDDPNALCNQARAYLRDKFRTSDFGMTGGNFLVAETGQVACVENEGNQRQSVSTPRVLLSLVGIEKVIPADERSGGDAQAPGPQRDRAADHDLHQRLRRAAWSWREGRT
jgi:L-lactate dehydrogenase complex protein LldF